MRAPEAVTSREAAASAVWRGTEESAAGEGGVEAPGVVPHGAPGGGAAGDTQSTRLWHEYRRTRDRESRDRLILLYSPLVKFVAGRVAVGLPHHVDVEDLVSYGIIALIDAIERFDPDRHVKFQTYAIYRIRGGIIDEMRAIDWVPRSVRAKARAVEQAYADLHAKLRRAPTDAEVAEDLGTDELGLHAMVHEISRIGVTAFDELDFVGNDALVRAALGDTMFGSAAGPGTRIEEGEDRQLLVEAIRQLGERQRKVLVLYYFEELTLAEIGKILGVSESRICQIRTQAVLQLRGWLQAGRRSPADQGWS